MRPTNQQAYDRGSTIFSPDGRLYQVEYARQAVGRGSAAVGVRAADGVVLAARRRVRSRLQVAGGVEKLHRADGHLGVASAGHAADARRLVEFGRERAQRDRLRYGEPMGVEPFAKALADHVQEYTQTGGARPYGAALLVGGVRPGDDGAGEPRLFETDPSGTPTEWRAAAIGNGADAARGRLEEGYDPALPVADGVGLAIEALAAAGDDDALRPEAVAVGTVGADDGSFREADSGEKRERLDDLGLLDAAS